MSKLQLDAYAEGKREGAREALPGLWAMRWRK